MRHLSEKLCRGTTLSKITAQHNLRDVLEGKKFCKGKLKAQRVGNL